MTMTDWARILDDLMIMRILMKYEEEKKKCEDV